MKNQRVFQSIAGVLAVTVLGILALSLKTWGHCQIPCGIYDDALRFKMLKEHFRTLEKSMNEINLLSKEPDKNFNQLGRWVQNKEDHTQQIVEIITAYFLQQRIKPVDKGDDKEWNTYINKVILCHKMLVTVMKAKQTTDPLYVRQLETHLAEFEKIYSESPPKD